MTILLETLRAAGGSIGISRERLPVLFDLETVELAERQGLVWHDAVDFWGVQEELTLTKKGWQALGLKRPSIFSRVMGLLKGA